MKDQKHRQKSVVVALLVASGSAFVIQACAPIVAELGAAEPASQVTVSSADLCASDSGRGDAQ